MCSQKKKEFALKTKNANKKPLPVITEVLQNNNIRFFIIIA